MKRLLIDMDGTLARFYDQAKCVEKMQEPEFFLNLLPYENMVKAAKMLSQRTDLSLIILSAVDGEAAKADKKTWISANLGQDIPCMFCGSGQSKAEFVREKLGQITEDDYLLDDYSRNLVEWESAGGSGIKFINELNGRGWNGFNYGGRRIYYDQAPEEIVRALLIETDLALDDRIEDPVSETAFLRTIDEIMTGKLGWHKDTVGWQSELYAGSGETLPERALIDIFSCDDPYIRFFELMDEWYGGEEAELLDTLLSELREGLSEIGGQFRADSNGRFLNEDVENLFQKVVDSGTFMISCPYSHFLDQKFGYFQKTR